MWRVSVEGECGMSWRVCGMSWRVNVEGECGGCVEGECGMSVEGECGGCGG